MLAIVIVIIVTVLGTSQGNKVGQDGTLREDFNLYSNSWFSINFPKAYQREGDYVNVTFTAKDSSQGGTTDSYKVSRYTDVGAVPDIEKFKEAISSSGATVETTRIGENDAVVTKIAGETPYTDYYIFGEAFVWKISFYYTSGSQLEKNAGKIASTFIPKDSATKDLLSLRSYNREIAKL